MYFGPIALVEEGDLIEIDVKERKLNIIGIAGERKSMEEIDAIGPPSTASGLQWPMTGPVEAPEKRPSVISAMLFPSSLSLLIASEV